MSDTKRTRPDDPVMAQKAAIDANVPYDDGAEDAATPASVTEPPAELSSPEPTPAGPEAPAAPLAEPTEQVKSADPSVRQVLARMQAEIAELRSQAQAVSVEEGDTGPGGYPWQYYKRRDDGGLMAGWVTIGPGGAVPSGPRRGRHDSGSRQTYTAKGMRLITDCGVAPIPSDVRRPGEEFIPLLRNGGARYVPVTQVLALKWHLAPPVPGIIFSDYEQNKHRVKVFACDDCEFECYFLADDAPTIRGCFSHLRQSHEYRREEAALALRAQDIDFRGARFAVQAAGVAAGVSDQPPVPAGFEEYADTMKRPPD